MLDCLRRGGRLCATRRQRVFILAFLLALGLLHPFVTLDNHVKKAAQKQKPEISTDSTGFRTTWSYNVTLSNSAVRLHQMSSTNSSVRAPDAQQNKEIALVVLAATRPEVHQLVRQLVAQKPDSGFRIMISLDGTEKQTNEVLQQIETPEVKLLRLSDDKSHKFKPSSDTYVKIARHYLRVLDHLILKLNYSYVVLMEDDLLIAPDFYQYFSSLRRALDSDESIFCVSAWNDNGQIGLVTEDPQLLHRTDFFPGLGWMINRRHWLQVRKVWPKTQYDDFLRLYMLNNRLVCVRPELSRTFNIGRNGGRVLSGKNGYSSTFYHNYLSRMALNSFNVTLLDSSIDKVIGRSADIKLEKFARSLPVMNVSTLLSQPKPPSAVRLRYASAEEFIGIAERIGAIPEVWFGAPRASILGISVMSLRRIRVYIVPDKRLPITKKILTPEHVRKKQKKDPKKKNDSKKKVVTKKKQDPKQKKDYKKKKNLKKQKDQKKKEDPKQKEDPKKKRNLKKQKDQKKKEDPKQKEDPKKKEDRKKKKGSKNK